MIILLEKFWFYKDYFFLFIYFIIFLYKNFIELLSEILLCYNIKKFFEIICVCILVVGNFDLLCELKVIFDIMCGVKLLKMRLFCYFLVVFWDLINCIKIIF